VNRKKTKIFSAIIIVLIVVLIVSYINKNSVPELTFDNNKLLELQEKPQLKIPE
jgi:uncharacterized protein YpmB